MSGLVKIPSRPDRRVYRNGGIFLETISLPSTPHELGYEATVSWYEEGGRLSDIYGELSEVLTKSNLVAIVTIFSIMLILININIVLFTETYNPES